MVESFAEAEHLPAFRVVQFNRAFYRECIASFDALTTWPKDLRDKLSAAVPFTRLTAVRSLVSAAKDTEKVLFARLSDGQKLEAVLMRHRDGRNTVCVSCMVGCPVGCLFCATGKMGFRANLTADEIVDQVLYFARELLPRGEAVTNVVFMGMGEPMLNLDAVRSAIAIMTDPAKMAMSERRITVSTSGYAAQLAAFVDGGYRGRLALSLHAPDQTLRERIMPPARTNPLGALFAVLDRHAERTNKRISYEYILIRDINDGPEHARQLADLLEGRLAHVNLIPYNPVAGIPYARSPKAAVSLFAHILADRGIPHTVRVTMGEDIAAACGQLAVQEPAEIVTLAE